MIILLCTGCSRWLISADLSRKYLTQTSCIRKWHFINFSHWSKRGCIKGNNSDNNNWNKQHLAIPWALYYIKQYNIISTLSGTSSSSVMLTDQIIQYFWKLCALGTTKSPTVNSGQRLSESHVNDVWCQWCLRLIFLVLWCRRKCVTKLILMCTVIRIL